MKLQILFALKATKNERTWRIRAGMDRAGDWSAGKAENSVTQVFGMGGRVSLLADVGSVLVSGAARNQIPEDPSCQLLTEVDVPFFLRLLISCG